MRRTLASLAAASTLATAALAAAPAAHAYGPYTHAYIAAEAGKRLGLDAASQRWYVAGALLADLDKANRLRAMLGSDALVRLLQGCTGEGPIARPLTHDASSAMVAKLVTHADARARALGLGMRNHGSTDRYADTTGAARLGRANSGTEDLAFDVAHARGAISGAAAALDGVIASGLLDDATARGFISAASGLADGAVRTQMRGYSCFVRGYVRDKARFVAPLLKAMLYAGYAKDCAKKNGLRAVTRCTPKKLTEQYWDKLTGGHTQIAREAIDAAITDYRAATKK